MAYKSITKKRKKIIFYILIEFLLLFFSYSIVFFSSNKITISEIYTFFILLFWPIISYLTNRYENIFTNEELTNYILKIFFTSLIIMFFYNFFATLLDLSKIYKSEFKIAYSFNSLFSTLFINIILNIIAKVIFRKKIKRTIERIKWFYIGSDKNLEILNQNISNSSYSRFIKIKKLEKNNFHRINNSNIIIDHEDKIGKPYNSLIDKNIENIKQISTIEDWYEATFERIPVDLFTLENISQIKQKSSRNNISNKVKRIGDILLSLLLLILLIPISLIVSILIWLEDRGPIIYKQKRVGLNGKIFNIYKFRSMNINAEVEGIKWATKNDPRTTHIGKIIRKTRFDEIPQLFSVLKGEMSLIGPRPERPEIEKILKEKIRHYNLKYLIKPGLSGWAQVNYPYGSSIEDSKFKLSFDIFYIKNKTVFLDFIIFLKTMRIVFNFHRFGSN